MTCAIISKCLIMLIELVQTKISQEKIVSPEQREGSEILMSVNMKAGRAGLGRDAAAGHRGAGLASCLVSGSRSDTGITVIITMIIMYSSSRGDFDLLFVLRPALTRGRGHGSPAAGEADTWPG